MSERSQYRVMSRWPGKEKFKQIAGPYSMREAAEARIRLNRASDVGRAWEYRIDERVVIEKPWRTVKTVPAAADHE